MNKFQHPIVRRYAALLRSTNHLLIREDIVLMRKAYKIVIDNENDENRISENELIKTLDVALIIVNEIGLSKTSIICVLLNLAVERGLISIDEVLNMFGTKVVHILKGLKEITNIYNTKKLSNTENFRKLLLTFAEDVRVQLIFLAEKLYTLRTANTLSEEQKIQLVQETDYIYIPFAHRLGLYNIKSEMEDKSLSYSEPKVYKNINKKLKESKDTREAYIAEFLAPIVTELERRGLKFKAKYRTKTIASIYNKMKKNQVEFDEIYDIFAVRFIIDSVGENEKADCWKAYSIVTDKYMPNTKRLRDWVTVPKSNGYESLQITVLGPQNRWVEVQIRTERMDDVAEHGFAAHWRYKGGTSDSIMDKWLSELREILETGDNTSMSLLDDMQINLQDNEVNVFTPNGDVITLPVDATLLDFAYAIHSNLGDKCVGGIVNNKNETLRYVLKNGDQVSITTSSNQQPKADWLNFAVTSKARNKIRHFINEEVNNQAVIGRETLLRRFKNWKLDFNDEVVRKLMQHYKYKFALDFYHGVAIGKHDLADIKEFLVDKSNKQEQASLPIEIKEIASNTTTSSNENVLLIDRNVDSVEYKFARCCNPVFGDDIVGFVSIGEGIKVHRAECKNLIDLQNRYPYRIVSTAWTQEGTTSYQVVLRIVGDDKSGIISEITELISKNPNANLRGIAINSSEGVFSGNITVLINNAENLTSLISRLKTIQGVTRVTRHHD